MSLLEAWYTKFFSLWRAVPQLGLCSLEVGDPWEMSTSQLRPAPNGIGSKLVVRHPSASPGALGRCPRESRPKPQSDIFSAAKAPSTTTALAAISQWWLSGAPLVGVH